MIQKYELSVTWFCLLRNCGDATKDFNGELVKKASMGDWTVSGEGSCEASCSNFGYSVTFAEIKGREKHI